MSASPFGEMLRALRREHGLSQIELAQRLGSTQRHLSFLETGRARPSRSMLQRIERELSLPIPRSHVLYDLAGFASPHTVRAEESLEARETLDLIEHRILANWPFPAFVLDTRWTIQRLNGPGKQFISEFVRDQNEPENLFKIFLSPAFRKCVLNWEDVAPALAARLFKEAAKDRELSELLEQAQNVGILDDRNTACLETVPVFVPAVISGPNGSQLRLTSLLGQLASAQDAIIEGMTIELMVPMDAATEDLLLGNGSTTASIRDAK